MSDVGNYNISTDYLPRCRCLPHHTPLILGRELVIQLCEHPSFQSHDQVQRRRCLINYVRKRNVLSDHKTCPLTLTFAGSICKSFSAMRTTTENASLISKREISSTVKFALFNACGRATVGAIGKSIGSTPASAYAVGAMSQITCTIKS